MNLKLGIVGWPLTKTYSPIIHKLLGEFLGINVWLLFDLSFESLVFLCGLE